MTPSAISGKCPRQLVRGLGDDLVRIAPQNFARALRGDRPHRQATFLDQPSAIARAADRFPSVRMEPADAPDRVAALEMPANTAWERQMPVEPVELVSQFIVDPVRAAGIVQVPGRMKEARLHPAVGMDQRRNKPHIHDDTRGACSHRVPLAQIRNVESRPPAALAHGRRETACEMHIHAFHRCLRGVSQKRPRLVRSIQARAVTLVPQRHQEV